MAYSWLSALSAVDAAGYQGIANPDVFRGQLAEKLEGASLHSYAKLEPLARAQHLTHQVYRLRTLFSISLTPQEVRLMEDAVDAEYAPKRVGV